jgi:hypothetical protein
MKCVCWICQEEYEAGPDNAWSICCPKHAPRERSRLWPVVMVLLGLAALLYGIFTWP